MDDFDQDQIALAIALSVEEANTQSRGSRPTKPPEVIEILDDDDNTPIMKPQTKASPLTKGAADTGASTTASSRQGSTQPPESTSSAVSVSSNAKNPLLFNRKQMEQERLARLKRLRPDISPKPEGNSSEDDDEDDGGEEEEGGERQAKRQRLSSTFPSARSANAASSSIYPATNGNADGGPPTSREELFWEGELRQTANKHVDKDTRPVFRLSEIIGPKEDIIFAILSSYVIDLPWLYGFFKIRTPVVVVAHDPQGNETMKEVLPEWIRTTPFLPGGWGCMHMKFMLIFYKTGRLRISVSTANLVPIDWRDIENTAWIQDFPLRPTPIRHDPKANDFPTAFSRVLRAVNVVPALLQAVRNDHDDLPIKRLEDLRCKWDFSKAKVHLIPSLAGKHEGWPKVIQTGHPALMKAIRDMGARAGIERDLTLECQGSSIGSYTTQWTNEFYCSTRGESAEEWIDQPKARRAKLPYPPLKILFPSAQTVKESVLGEPGGGTMFCRRNQWGAAKFPRELFYDSNSKRGKVLMHSKMVIGMLQDNVFASTSNKPALSEDESDTEPESDDEIVEVKPEALPKLAGWAYVGSHNFTPSAWGTLSGSGFNPTLSITNFELGVAFPLKNEKELEAVACWRRPARKYVLGRDEPWMQSESPYFAQE